MEKPLELPLLMKTIDDLLFESVFVVAYPQAARHAIPVCWRLMCREAARMA